MNKNSFFLILLLLFNNSEDFFMYSQTYYGPDDVLQIRYWHYRDRLKYFVVNNENSDPNEPGIANVSDIRDRTAAWATGPYDGCHTNDYMYNIQFDQQLSSSGYYIGMLATEYLILKSSNLAQHNELANKTLDELHRALLSIVRLDMCESKWPYYNPPDKWDGYMIRSDVPPDFPSIHSELNEGLDLNASSIEQNPGVPIRADFALRSGIICGHNDEGTFFKQNEMSRDEISKLYIGLALVKRCISPVSPEEWEVYNLNKDIAKKIYNKIANAEYDIYNPNGDLVNYDPGDLLDNHHPGARMWDLACGFYDATKYICDNDPAIINPIAVSLNNAAYWCDTWQSYRTLASNNASISYISARFACIADNWTDPLNNNNKTYEGIINCTQSHERHCENFYVTLWKFLHNKVTYDENADKEEIENKLLTAPCEGPCDYYGNPNTGWRTSFKWDFDANKQINGGGEGWYGNYSGLDYLLMYNLYLLSYCGGGYFVNYNDVIATNYCPVIWEFDHQGYGLDPPYTTTSEEASENHPGILNAFYTITSYQQIRTTAEYFHVSQSGILSHTVDGPQINGNMTYTATKQIRLVPGFKVEPGAYFHAQIADVNCDLSPISTITGPLTQVWLEGGYIQQSELNDEKNYIISNTDTSYNSNINSNNIIVYPNPFYDCINIIGINEEPIKYTISDISNKIIKSGTIQSFGCFEDLQDGFYILNILVNGVDKSYKLCKL